MPSVTRIVATDTRGVFGKPMRLKGALSVRIFIVRMQNDKECARQSKEMNPEKAVGLAAKEHSAADHLPSGLLEFIFSSTGLRTTQTLWATIFCPSAVG